MEWQLDLLDLLEELLRVDLVDELALLVLGVLHLQSKDRQHEELLLWVPSQGNIVHHTRRLLHGLLFNAHWWQVSPALLLNKLDVDLGHIIAVLGSVPVVSADWRSVVIDWLSGWVDQRSRHGVGILLQSHRLHSNDIASLTLVAAIVALQFVLDVAHLLWGGDRGPLDGWLRLRKFIRGINSVQFGWSNKWLGGFWEDEALPTADADEGHGFVTHIKFGVCQRGLLLPGLVLDLFGQSINFLLLLRDHLIHFVALQISLELLLLEHQVVLLDLIKNLLGLVLPLKVDLPEVIDFFNLVHFQFFIFLDLLLENLEVSARLRQLLIVLAIVVLVLDLHSLDFLVKLVAFDLIISNGVVRDPQFLLTILEILLPLVNLLLRVQQPLLVTLAIILQRIHAGFILVHLFLQNTLPAIKFLNGLDLFSLPFKRVLREHRVMVKILKDFVVM